MASNEIFKPLANEEKDENARLTCFVGAAAIGDLLKTTLGPKGMDKILIKPGRHDKLNITNDGATIMRSIGIDNPAAKVLIEMAKVQDDNIGDGTTSVVVLAAELLREAEQLTNKGLHPQTIVNGWQKALDAAEDELANRCAFALTSESDLRRYLLHVARITMSSKIIVNDVDHFCNLAVDAVMRVHNKNNKDEKVDLQHICVLKKLGAPMTSSFLDEGFILDKRIPGFQSKRLADAKILLANTQMDYDKVKVFGTKVVVNSTAKLAEIEAAEKLKMKEKVDNIVRHGVNCFINRQLIYNYPQQLMVEKGIMVIEHADFEGVERLSKVLNADIVSTFDTPEAAKLGRCGCIEEIMIGEEKLIKFSNIPNSSACTIVLRGSSEQFLDEAERALHDVLCVLAEVVVSPRFVYGGGATELALASRVHHESLSLVSGAGNVGKESMAMDSFGKALRQLPTAIADNAGLDSSELVARLAVLHNDRNNKTSHEMGLDVEKGAVGNMRELNVIESYKVKYHVLVGAKEAAEAIIRVDNILRAAPRQRTK